MEYEEQVTFTYVEALLEGRDAVLSDRSHHLLSKHHESIDSKLRELKNLFIQYYPQQDTDYDLNAVIFELYRAQEDLEMHCRVEDHIFVPAVRKLAHLTTQRNASIEEQPVHNAANDQFACGNRTVIFVGSD